MATRSYYVYIMTNYTNNVLYTGVTNNLIRRIKEHANKRNKGFSMKYHLSKLVYYEEYQYISDAIKREKLIKGGSRKEKIKLILRDNEMWRDLLLDW